MRTVQWHNTSEVWYLRLPCFADVRKCGHCMFMLMYCRELGIDPTADTYTVLMCESAEKGDIKGIEKVGGCQCFGDMC